MSAPSALGLSVSVLYLLGTSRSNDVDGNENVKKKNKTIKIGLIRKTTTLHVHHTVLYISFPFCTTTT